MRKKQHSSSKNLNRYKKSFSTVEIMRYLKTEMLNDSRAVETYVGQDRYMHHIYSKTQHTLLSRKRIHASNTFTPARFLHKHKMPIFILKSLNVKRLREGQG